MNVSPSEPAAGLDYGSNSLRLYIAASDAEGNLLPVHRERVALRLATEAFEQGCFSRSTVESLVEISEGFAREMDRYGTRWFRAVATEAFRRASNAGKAVETVFNRTGIKMDIIEPAREAQLVMDAVRNARPHTTEPDLLVDMGGGSVELIAPSADRANGEIRFESHALGLVARFDRVFREKGAGIETREELKRQAQEIGRAIRSGLIDDIGPSSIIAFVGGQAEMLDHLALTWGIWGEGESRGAGISPQQFDELCDRAVSEPTEVLLKIGVTGDRAPLLPGSAALYRAIAQRSKAGSILLPCVGLLEGLLVGMGQHGRSWPPVQETRR